MSISNNAIATLNVIFTAVLIYLADSNVRLNVLCGNNIDGISGAKLLIKTLYSCRVLILIYHNLLLEFGICRTLISSPGVISRLFTTIYKV